MFGLFNWLFPKPKYKPNNTCKECGRVYNDPDSAAVCGDWDNVFGVQRHKTYKKKL